MRKPKKQPFTILYLHIKPNNNQLSLYLGLGHRGERSQEKLTRPISK